jgi:hypothetical protein
MHSRICHGGPYSRRIADVQVCHSGHHGTEDASAELYRAQQAAAAEPVVGQEQNRGSSGRSGGMSMLKSPSAQLQVCLRQHLPEAPDCRSRSQTADVAAATGIRAVDGPQAAVS